MVERGFGFVVVFRVFFKVLSLITIVCNRNDENLFMYFI